MPTLRKITQAELERIQSNGGKVNISKPKPSLPSKPKEQPSPPKQSKELELAVSHISESTKATQQATDAIAVLSTQAANQTAQLMQLLEQAINTNREVKGAAPVRLKVNRSKGLIDSIDVIPLVAKQ